MYTGLARWALATELHAEHSVRWTSGDAVVALVYVGAFAPDHGESAFQLSAMFRGSTLAEALTAHPVATGVSRPDEVASTILEAVAATVPVAVAAS